MKMEKIIVGLLSVSIVLNVYLIYDALRIHSREEYVRSLNLEDNNKTTWADGFKLLTKRLKEKSANLANKKYYYINTWASFCSPCIKEMPWLDSLAGTLNKDVAYIFVSDMDDKSASQIIKRRNYNLRNFVLINDMNDFISGIFNEQKTKIRSYPVQMIIEKNGNIVYYSLGAFENLNEASEFVAEINKLK